MKKFTVKDFILATGPCFGCREKLSYSIGFVDLSEVRLRPYYKPLVVLPDYSEIDLKINYDFGLKLRIYHKTNQFWSSNFKQFTKFIESTQLYLHTGCDKCHLQVDSQYLTFNLSKGFVFPTGISKEVIWLLDNNNLYSICNDTMRNETRVTIAAQGKSFSDATRLKLPLLFLHKFKNKNQLIDKLKLYALFS
jgi:hypothetical protein